MRKNNVFGKSNNASRPLYTLAIVFVAVIIGYVALLIYSSVNISNLQTENSQIQQSINNLLLNEQSKTYKSVEELIPYLPNEFTQSTVYNEIILTRNLSGLELSNNFHISFIIDSDNPFEETINTDLKYVKISISFSTDDPAKALDYVNNIISLDRLYYVNTTDLNILSSDNTMVVIDLYTFYL